MNETRHHSPHRRAAIAKAMRWSGTVLAASLLAAALIAMPAQAAAQATSASQPDVPGDAGTRDAVRVILASASTKGIPVEPLLTKVREGVAKRSTPERIRDAVQALAGRLETASTSLAPVQSTGELSAAADALQAGIPTSALRQLRRQAPGRSLVVPLGVATELVAAGVPAKLAASRIGEILERRGENARIIELGRQVGADIASGLAPNAAMELRSKSVLTHLANPFGTAIRTPIRPGGAP